jgi:Glyoxalase-like domain
MKINVDHVTLCGSELPVMRQALADVGLATDYGGPHANGVTHMALLGFEDGSYLELIAPLRPGRAEGSPWRNLMLGDAGPGAWAVGTPDIQAEVRRLTSLGIETAGPEPGSRRRPDEKLLEWQTASAGPGTPGAMLPFMIQDHTPREWRVQTTASMKGSGLSGIATVVLGVRAFLI